MKKIFEEKKAESERQRKLQEQKVVYAPARTAAVDNPKDKVAMYESHNNYSAINGRYIGKYQLDMVLEGSGDHEQRTKRTNEL